MPESKAKEKEREAQLKALREELEAQMEADLAEAGFPAPPLKAVSPGSADLSPKRVLEALLFASAKPLTIVDLKKVVGAPFMAPTDSEGAINRAPTVKDIEKLISELRDEYGREGRSFELIEIAGGWQIVTKKEYASWLARLEQQKKAKQASHSALETLAILAYKQPVTRAEIEGLRGVDISGVLSTLLERGFVKIVGKKEVPGRPFLYGTTEKFLEHFGLKSIAGLPQISEIKTLVERAVKREDIQQPAGEAPAPVKEEETTGPVKKEENDESRETQTTN